MVKEIQKFRYCDGLNRGSLMWNFCLYPMDMFYCHWLINKLFGLWHGRILLGGKIKLNAGRKKAESSRSHIAPQEARCEDTNNEPHRIIQNNKNGLI